MSMKIVKMVKLSPTMNEGHLVRWLFKEGDKVAPEALLFEVQTDKATMGYSDPDGGYLRKILVPAGASAPINAPVAIFTESADEPFELPKQEVKAPVKEEVVSEVKQAALPTGRVVTTTAFLSPPVKAPFPFRRAIAFEERVKASPHLREAAKSAKLSIEGLAPNSSLLDGNDLPLAIPEKLALLRALRSPPPIAGEYTLLPMTPMRRVIAERLSESKGSVPHFYLEKKVEVSALLEIREQLKREGIKLTVNDFVIRACALALAAHPDVNLAFDPQSGQIARFHSVDIGVAVSISEGLITPLIRHASSKRIEELSLEMRKLAEKAKSGALKPEEYQGGSMTISNLGMYGIDSFFAILNPPQPSILAVGAANDEAVIKNGAVVAGKVMHLGLSVDHRVIDGAVAASFLSSIAHYLENPALLIL